MPETEEHEVIEGTATEEPSPAPEVPAGIFVRMVETEGGAAPEISPQGGLDITSVATILELAVKRWRAQIGLD